MINDRRLGQFRISLPIIEDNPDVVRQVMAKCIIVRAEFMWGTGEIDYVAICNDFRPVIEGGSPPFYRAIFHSEKGFVGWEMV